MTHTKTVYTIYKYNRGTVTDIEVIKKLEVFKGSEKNGWKSVYKGKNPIFKAVTRGTKGKLTTRTSIYRWDMDIEHMKFGK